MDEEIVIGILVALAVAFVAGVFVQELETPGALLIGGVFGVMAYVLVGDLKKRRRR